MFWRGSAKCLQKRGDFSQERVADDFVGLQIDDGDAGGFAGEAVEEIAEAVVVAGELRIVDLGEVTHDDHLRAVTETSDDGASLTGAHVLDFVINDEAFGEGAATHFYQRDEFDRFADELFHFALGGGVGFRGDGDFLDDFDDLVEIVGEAESLGAGLLFAVAREGADIVAKA